MKPVFYKKSLPPNASVAQILKRSTLLEIKTRERIIFAGFIYFR
jgi:hypothetical protein